jgi:hypothetical protein
MLVLNHKVAPAAMKKAAREYFHGRDRIDVELAGRLLV